MRVVIVLCLTVLVVASAIKKENESKDEREARIRAMLADGKTEQELDEIKASLKKNKEKTGRHLKESFKGTGRKWKKSRRLPAQNEQKPFDQGIQQVNAAEGLSDYLFQGDMNLASNQLEAFTASDVSSKVKRMAEYNSQSIYKWTVEKPINYRFNGSFTDKAIKAIRLGLAYWEKNTCLSFKENGEGPQMVFVKESGCWSSVGRMTSPSQKISIGVGCEYPDTVIHEVAHALGFIHEQARNDRDQYITINTPNVNSIYQGNFGKMGNVFNYPQSYDYASIMQYAPYDFAINTNEPTMIPANPIYIKSMGGDGPQLLDAMIVNVHYGCTDKCVNMRPPKCQHNGMVHPRDCNKCLCAAPYTGDFCELRSPGRAPQVALGTCGAELIPTFVWQTASAEVGGETDPLESQECFWTINTVTKSQKLEVQITKVDGDYCAQTCYWQGAQIYLNDNPNANHITFCCQADLEGKVLKSNGTVAIRGFSRFMKMKFTFQYRLVL